MMNYFSALHKYDLEIRFHRRDLYQTSAFCGHVFTMKLLLKKLTLGHMTENKCGYQMHIFVTSFSAQHAPAWRCFCMVQPLRQPFRPKCTNRILQMHQQNPVVPPESGVHPQNPVCTYSVIWLICNTIWDNAMSKPSWKFGEPKWNPYWVIMLTSSSGTNCVPIEHEDLDQYAIPNEIMRC